MMNRFLLTVLLVAGLSAVASASDAWNQKTHFGGPARHRGSGLAIGNKGYMGLGHYNGSGFNMVFSDWWEFDPSANTWSQKADYPYQTYAASQFTIGNKGYVGCGIGIGSQFYCYDALANTWTAIQNCPVGVTDQVGFSVNGKGYFIYSTYLYEYDPQFNQWTTKNNPPFSCGSWASTFTIGDKAYVKTGNQLYEYKSLTDEWAIRAAFPGLATGGSASFSINGKGYIVCGGYIGWLSEITNEVWEYDPTTNAWIQLDDFPAMSRRFTTGFAIGNRGYVGIGTNGTNMRDFWEFDKLLSVDEQAFVMTEPFPNPSSGSIRIALDNNGAPVNLLIFDPTGKMVLNRTDTDGNFEIFKEDLGSGIFVYRILAGNEMIKTGKIVFI